MTRKEEFERKVMIGIDMEDSEKKDLKEIACRDCGGNISKLGRKALVEYIESHKEGNNAFKLDKWNENPDFKAVPTFFSKFNIWKQYYSESNKDDRTEIRKQLVTLLNMCKFIESQK